MDFPSVDVTLAEPDRETPIVSAIELAPNRVDPIADSSAEPTPCAAARLTPFSKAAIRTSLKASTLDGVFATVFSNITGGVLLTNFLMELHASPAEIGLLASIPMLANLMQPLGAYFSERTTSRHLYCLWIYGVSRSLWLLLAIGILILGHNHSDPHLLVLCALAVALLSYGLGALGSAPWLSWMAALVPRRLRGRYFSVRNSAANLTNLVSIPLTGFLVANWFGGSLQGYGVMLLLGVAFGLLSLWFQTFMADVNPQEQRSHVARFSSAASASASSPTLPTAPPSLLQNSNFLLFLLYFSFWMFAVNLSAPFFNLYLLDTLKLDVSQVSLYNSLTAAANLLMLMFWGKLADRIGNRGILIAVGILVAVTPLLWLVTGTDALSIWLWLPLLHLLAGGTWAAIDLCGNNLQIGVAPVQQQSACFGMVAAVAGVSSALGTLTGGVLVQFSSVGGLLGLFAFSSILRLAALLPLVFVREQRTDYRQTATIASDT